MPRVVISETAVAGLERCRRFLAQKNRPAANSAGEVIARQFELLESTPNIGRPLYDLPELRELVISFGDSGYVALYRHDPEEDVVSILAFRHQKEAGY